ncbi:MAG: hypothetical protein ACT4QF_11250 [Sporichthyaceae bacterium]
MFALVLAAVQLGQAADLFFGANPTHSQSELAAWHAAAAVGLLTGAAKPYLVDALMPVMAGAAAVTVLISVRDVVALRTTASEEVAHLFLVLGFLVLTMLWMGQNDEAGRRQRSRREHDLFDDSPSPDRAGQPRPVGRIGVPR